MSITTGTIVRAMLVITVFATLFYLQDVVLVVLTSVVIASAVEPLTSWFCRRRIPRVMAVIGIYIVLAVIFVGVFYSFVPSLLSDTAQVLRSAPKFFDTGSISFFSRPVENSGTNIAETLSLGFLGDARPSSFTAVFNDLAQILGSFASGFWDNISAVFGGIISFVLIVVLSFYLAVQEDGVGAFLRIVTPQAHEKYVVGLWTRARRKIGYWMQGQILLAVLVGILVYLGLVILGVKNALFLAVLAAIFETIPLFGPILSAIPGIAIAYAYGTLVAPAGFTSGLLVAGLYLIIQQFENHLIYPLVVKKIVGVPPILVILSLIIGAKLVGFLGLILSVPVAATLMEYLDDIQKWKASSAS